MLGASWKTALIGWLIIAGDGLKLLSDTLTEKGVPTDAGGWLGFGIALATGVGLILSKDYDKSNSTHPQQTAVEVPKPPSP